jgi:hypothetical protein
VTNEAVPNVDGFVPSSCGAVPDARSNQYYCQGTVFDGGKTRHIAGNVIEVERDVLLKYLEAFPVAAPSSSLSELPWPPKTGTALEQRTKFVANTGQALKQFHFFQFYPES